MGNGRKEGGLRNDIQNGVDMGGESNGISIWMMHNGYNGLVLDTANVYISQQRGEDIPLGDPDTLLVVGAS